MTPSLASPCGSMGSMVMSLETIGAYAAVYANLVVHAEEWGEPTSASKLTWKTWLLLRGHVACPGVALVPKLLERAC